MFTVPLREGSIYIVAAYMAFIVVQFYTHFAVSQGPGDDEGATPLISQGFIGVILPRPWGALACPRARSGWRDR